jgi:hypothetical protein
MPKPYRQAPTLDGHDNFFDLGGHSLLIVAALGLIERATGIRPSVADFFDAPTVAELSEKISLGQRAHSLAPAIVLRPLPNAGPRPGGDDWRNSQRGATRLMTRNPWTSNNKRRALPLSYINRSGRAGSRVPVARSLAISACVQALCHCQPPGYPQSQRSVRADFS